MHDNWPPDNSPLLQLAAISAVDILSPNKLIYLNYPFLVQLLLRRVVLAASSPSSELSSGHLSYNQFYHSCPEHSYVLKLVCRLRAIDYYIATSNCTFFSQFKIKPTCAFLNVTRISMIFIPAVTSSLSLAMWQVSFCLYTWNLHVVFQYKTLYLLCK